MLKVPTIFLLRKKLAIFTKSLENNGENFWSDAAKIVLFFCFDFSMKKLIKVLSFKSST